MSDANAKSSTKASKKEVEILKLVGGQINADKTFEMPPENAIEFRENFEEIVIIKAENYIYREKKNDFFGKSQGIGK